MVLVSNASRIKICSPWLAITDSLFLPFRALGKHFLKGYCYIIGTNVGGGLT